MLEVKMPLVTETGTDKDLRHIFPEAPMSPGREDYIVNLGYREEGEKGFLITLPYKGVYKFDQMNIIERSLENYPLWVEKLKESTVENLEFSVDELSCNISVDKPKVLCIAIPYSDGWSAYVDGKEAYLMIANMHYMGVELTEGQHEIVLKYSRPLQTIGYFVSLGGLVIAVIYLIIYHKRNSKSE